MNKTKKILYITPALPVGGAEKFLISLSSELAEHTSQQTIVSLSAINTLEPEIDKRVKFLSLPRRSKFDNRPLRELRRMVKTEKPDIIFCINFFSYFVIRCAMVSLRSKSQIIISYHSTEHLTRKEHLLHKLYATILTKKDRIITVSEKQTAYAIKTYGIPARKFKVIYNCVDTSYWKPAANDEEKKELRKKYDIPADAKLIILTAAFRPEKNHIGAIRALQLLHTRYNLKAYLLFVGDGAMRELIEKTASELYMNDHIKMAGLQKNVLPFYQAADLFTLCSLSVETFSIAALEAMSCGLPGVLTDIGGAREMISDGVNGFVCAEDNDSIAQAWLKGLNAGFSKEAIHEYAHTNFKRDKMISEYKTALGITA